MKTLSKITPAIFIAITATFSLSPAKAFTITQENNPSTLLSNLLGDTTGLSNFEVQPIGDGRAFGIFEGDPFNLDSGVVLSTGRVTDLVGENTEDGGFTIKSNDLSTDFGASGELNDSISLVIGFDANGSKDALFFQYIFGSEEFVEFGGSSFNDEFSLTLNGRNFAELSDGSLVTISNLVPNPFFGYNPDFVYNPVGTGPASNEIKLDGYTQSVVDSQPLLQPLLFEAPLIKNARNTLIINVRDVEDGILDTAVFIKGGTVGTAEPPPIVIDDGGDGNGDNGDGRKIPEPNSVLGLLLFSTLYAVHFSRKRIRKV